MSLRFIDSFDHYSTAAVMAAKWSTIIPNVYPLIEAGEGRCGSNALHMGPSAIASVTKGPGWTTATVIVGFALRVVTQTSPSIIKFCYLANNTDDQLGLARGSDGSLVVLRMDNATGVVLGTSAVDVVRTGEYYYIEFKATIDPAAGAYEVRVNGVNVLSAAGVDTESTPAGAGVTQFRFASHLGIDNYFEDVYALDSAGGAPQNDFFGDSKVEYLQPDGVGANQAWDLVGAATHWQAVDDGDAPDGDTSYIHTATVGLTDTEAYAPTGLPTGTIFGVQVMLYARKTDSGLRSIAPIVRHAGADFAGTNVNPSFASYNYLMQLYETNPGTAAAWTIADVNAAEFGVRLTV
jgi:hypothetical protein